MERYIAVRNAVKLRLDDDQHELAGRLEDEGGGETEGGEGLEWGW